MGGAVEIASERAPGALLAKGALGRADQVALLADIEAVLADAPPYRLSTRRGQPLSVRMSAAGRYAWFSDRRGYRYVEAHPLTGRGFPPIPPLALAQWRRFETRAAPDGCLINLYAEGARMGLHQDRDEADFSFPVVSISLGDPALFRIGGTARGGSTRSVWLESGDVLALTGESRLAFHGIDRIKPGTSDLLAEGGRINLTLRRVAPA